MSYLDSKTIGAAKAEPLVAAILAALPEDWAEREGFIERLREGVGNAVCWHCGSDPECQCWNDE